MPWAYEREPARPLKLEGHYTKLRAMSPLRYAIDAANQCWLSFTASQPMAMVTADELIQMLLRQVEANTPGDFAEVEEVRWILGMPLARPEWMNLALAAGWTPPKG